VCSGADYTADNYLSGIVTFNNRGGRLAWGSTKTGGMWYDETFYATLGNGESFGKAFVAGFNAVKDLSYAPSWWHGMVMSGDASLVPAPTLFRDFQMTDIRRAGSACVIEWGSRTNRSYTLEAAANLRDGFAPVVTKIPGRPPGNIVTNTSDTLQFFRVLRQP
jgi:hypothetical protein